MTLPIPYLDAATVATLLTPAAAVDALGDALRAGFDPALAAPRQFFRAGNGELLMMPAEVGPVVGIKVATVAPGNAALGLPRITGLFVLFDGVTLQPSALLDGAALTTLRTPAVSVAAIAPALDRLSSAVTVVVFGAGPQGVGHLATLADVLGADRIARATYITRTPIVLADHLTFGHHTAAVLAGTPEARAAVAAADIIVCATSSAVPLFDAADVKDTVIAIAVGTHDADKREIPGALVGRSQVVVEDVTTALREGGDVITAIADGLLDPGDLITMRAVATGEITLHHDRPVVFKSSGMAWEDVVVAGAVLAAAQSGT